MESRKASWENEDQKKRVNKITKLYNEGKNTTCKDLVGGKSMMFSIN